MDPVLGALLSAAFGGIFDIGATITSNAYNSPRAQLRRVRKAGLPLAYMYQGRVNTQSQVPSLSIDPDLGSVERENIAIAKGQLGETTRMNEEEIRKIAEEIRKLALGNDITQGILNWNKEGGMNEVGDFRNNQQMMLDSELSLKKTQDYLQDNALKLSNMLNQVEQEWFSKGGPIQIKGLERDKIIQQLANLASQDKLLGQMYSIRKIEEVLNNSIGKNIEKKSDIEQGLMWGLMQLFSKL